ncbi:flagellar hook protein FlgE [Plasticicumulans lactativorans]|uniref:Flagellar hook protein FlgE n=1 Tax=Plasticicumulans lactativorans TaxID=1133106 RepID=A0A4R2L1I6_9GAMM|nr:flagellar hook protein FlgE [Plasticicumulans lactativorans]TCO80891.1 flagellar hook protein FlgE [Plasticicumulans lactativorans]
MSFRTALTGLNAATSDLAVVANNIANNNTTGFKSSRAEFSDIFSTSSLGTATRRTIGSGVQLAAVTQQFKQGNINGTGNPLDIAIDGEGFFKLTDQRGSVSYTRAGSFGIDRDGFVVSNIGQKLQAFPLDANDQPFGSPTDLKLTTNDIDPKATTKVEYGINLDAAATAIDASIFPFDPANPSTYNYTTSLAVYDSLGASHTLSVFFVKNPLASGATSSSWTVYGTLDGTDENLVHFGTALTDPNASSLSFDDKGRLLSPLTPLDVTIDLQGVATAIGQPTSATQPLAMKLDFTAATQFGGQSSTNNLVQDGYASGTLVGVNVADNGVMFGRYTNGQSKALGQLALHHFRNQGGLAPVGDTAWAETFASGPAVAGVPGSARLGLIRSGALEGSNVELTEQLVNMINAQRNFQANAQVISTSDSLTQTLLQIR